MKRILRSLFVISLAIMIIPVGLVFGSPEPSELASSPLAHQSVEGYIVAKGILAWEEILSSVNEFHLRREYLVLQNSYSPNELIVLEFEPFFISIDQFHLGEKVQAQIASDGSIISARHAN